MKYFILRSSVYPGKIYQKRLNCLTSNFLGFDFDLWSSDIVLLCHSKACTWLPIYLLLTFSLHIVPFWRYLTLRVWPWPLTLRSHPRSKYFCHSKAHTSFLSDFFWLSILYSFWDIWLQSLRVWPWSLTFRDHQGLKIFSPFESPYMTSYLTSIVTFYLVPFSRY